jgi:hypothetical protein
MTTSARRRRAAHQAGALLVCGAVGAAAGAWVAHLPAGPDELRITVATLRSQAAELHELFAQADEEEINPRFVRMHAQQLAQAVERERHALEQMTLDATLEPTRSEVRPIAAQLASAVQLTGRWSRSIEARREPPHRMARQLDAIEESLRDH